MAQYRPTLRARLLLSNGNVLTPRTGAPHADAFQVSSIAGDTGYQPYIIDIPHGPSNALDRLTGRTEIGDVELVLQDPRVDGSNIERWVTAFFGDADGVVQPHGLMLEITRRLTDAGSFEPFFKGRVVNLDVPDAAAEGAVVKIRARDERVQERRMAFVGAPTPAMTYAQPSPLAPIGARFSPWGPFKTIDSEPAPFGTMRTAGVTGALAIEVTDRDANHIEGGLPLALTAELASRLDDMQSSSVIDASAKYCPGVRVRVTRNSDGLSGDFFVCYTTPTRGGLVEYDGNSGRFAAPLYVTGEPGRIACFGITPIPASMDQGAHPLKRMALSAIPIGTLVTWTIYNAGPPSPAAPILISDVHPATLLRDLAAGDFTTLNDSGRDLEPNDGAIAFEGIPTDDAEFTAAESWTHPRVRFLIDRPWKMEEFVAQQLAQPHHITCVMDASGEMVPRDLRLSDADLASIPTLTAADIVTGFWEHGSDVVGEVQVTAYKDDSVWRSTNAGRGPQEEDIYETPPSGINTTARTARLYTEKAPQVPGRPLQLDAQGVRFPTAPGEAFGFDADFQRERQVFDPYNQMYGTGAATLQLTCRSTSNTRDRLPGDWLLVDYAGPPDPASNTRDGTRLMMVARSREDPFGPHVHLRLIDAGPNSVAVAPTVLALSQGTDTHNAVSVSITLNADSDPVEVRIAVTATSEVSAPADSSELWHRAAYIEASGDHTIRGVPSGMRVWLLARSVGSRKVASAWVSSVGADFVDTEALTAPSALSAIVAGRAIKLSWTVGESQFAVMPTVNGADALAAPLSAGANRYVFDDLDGSTLFTIGVKHVDPFGGVSATTTTMATTSTSAQLGDVRALEIHAGGGEAWGATPATQIQGALFTLGLVLGARVREAVAGIRWQVSLTADFAVIEKDFQTPAGTRRVEIRFDENLGAERFVRAAHVRTGYLQSANWSSVASAYPIVLMYNSGGAIFPGGSAWIAADGGLIKLSVLFDQDGDADRAYYGLARGAEWPTVDTSSDFITYEESPYYETVTVGDSFIQGNDEIRMLVRFWNRDTGFGQTARMVLPGGRGPSLNLAVSDITFTWISDTQVQASWTRGSLVDVAWVKTYNYDKADFPTEPWSNIPAMPDAELAVGTDTYIFTAPAVGERTLFQLEPRAEDLTVGPVERSHVDGPAGTVPTIDNVIWGDGPFEFSLSFRVNDEALKGGVLSVWLPDTSPAGAADGTTTLASTPATVSSATAFSGSVDLGAVAGGPEKHREVVVQFVTTDSRTSGQVRIAIPDVRTMLIDSLGKLLGGTVYNGYVIAEEHRPYNLPATLAELNALAEDYAEFSDRALVVSTGVAYLWNGSAWVEDATTPSVGYAPVLRAGVITAIHISVATLSEIVDNMGIIVSGTLHNLLDTAGLDLDATGVEQFLYHPSLSLLADGTAIFSGELFAASGTFAGDLSAAGGTFTGDIEVTSFNEIRFIDGGSTFGSIAITGSGANVGIEITSGATSLTIGSDSVFIGGAVADTLTLNGIPTSNPGGSGIVWNNGGVLNIT